MFSAVLQFNLLTFRDSEFENWVELVKLLHLNLHDPVHHIAYGEVRVDLYRNQTAVFCLEGNYQLVSLGFPRLDVGPAGELGATVCRQY